jgi:hypothetical protein
MRDIPQGKSVVLTVKKHLEAGPIFVKLADAGIDVEVVDEAKFSVGNFVSWLFAGGKPRPTGPYHVVVPEESLARAKELLQAS